MIYVASNYTDIDSSVMEDRYKWACRFTAEGLKSGFILYSPIVHCHRLAVMYEMPRDFSFWQTYNFSMLDVAKEVVFLMLPGWENSRGLLAELDYCIASTVPTQSFTPKTLGSDYAMDCWRFWQTFRAIQRGKFDALDI